MADTPSATLPGNPPTGTVSGTGLCCTCEVESRVSTNGEGTYFNSSFVTYGSVMNKCHLEYIRSGNGGRVEITVTYCLGYLNGASTAEHGAQMQALIRAAQVTWNQAARGFRLQIKQDGCPEQRLAIQFRFEVSPSFGDEDVSIYADNTPLPPNPTKDDNRSYVDDGSVMVFYLNEQEGGHLEWTMIHEFGHVFGQPDEYVELPATASPSGQGVTYTPVGPTPTVSYHKTATQPKGSAASGPTVVTLKPFAPGEDPGTYLFDADTVMGRRLSMNFFPENFFWLAIETEAIFAAQGSPATSAIIIA